MRTRMTLLAIAVAVGLGGGAIAPAAFAGDTPPAEASKPDKAKRVCKTIVMTGSRFSKRYCRTKDEWDKDIDSAQRQIEDSQIYGYRRDGEHSGTGFDANGSPR